MKEETMHRLTELDDIHLQIHCAVESVRQSYAHVTTSAKREAAKTMGNLLSGAV